MRGRTVKNIAAAIIGAAMMLSVPANTARADDRSVFRVSLATYGIQHQHQNQHHYGKRGLWGKRGFWRHKNYRHSRQWHSRQWHRPRRLSYRQWGQRCRPVSKVSRDHYGNRTIIGGKLCFNSHGESYIVPGSRYIIK